MTIPAVPALHTRGRGEEAVAELDTATAAILSSICPPVAQQPVLKREVVAQREQDSTQEQAVFSLLHSVRPCIGKLEERVHEFLGE
jgi:hypothetical protein